MTLRLHRAHFPLARKYDRTNGGPFNASPEAPRATLGNLVSAMPWCVARDLVVEFLRHTCLDSEIDEIARRAKTRRSAAVTTLFRD